VASMHQRQKRAIKLIAPHRLGRFSIILSGLYYRNSELINIPSALNTPIDGRKPTKIKTRRDVWRVVWSPPYSY
jgi:hypothetical protein